MKRLVVISDMHIGHQYGICPPKYQSRGLNGTIQEKFWNWFNDKARSLGRIDLLVVNGDAIDGNGERNSGVELITTDRSMQVDMAVEAIGVFDAVKTEIVLGTPYHTGSAENFEYFLAQRLQAGSQDDYTCKINDLVFNFKHKVNVSRNWSTMASGILREQLINLLTAVLHKGEIKADVVVRSHAHLFVNAVNIGGAVFVTPALQLDSSYGRRQCSGRPDIGFLSFDIEDRENWTWKGHFLTVPLVERSISII